MAFPRTSTPLLVGREPSVPEGLTSTRRLQMLDVGRPSAGACDTRTRLLESDRGRRYGGARTRGGTAFSEERRVPPDTVVATTGGASLFMRESLELRTMAP
jgi:hypothetical protein